MANRLNVRTALWCGTPFLLALLVFGVLGPTATCAQQFNPTPQALSVIQNNPQVYIGRTVELPETVTVTRILNQNGGTTLYQVRDARGAVIPVLTTGGAPDVNGEFCIEGRVEEARSGDSRSPVVINEVDRTPSYLCGWLLPGLVGLFLLVVGLGGFVYWQSRGSERESERTGERASAVSASGDGSTEVSTGETGGGESRGPAGGSGGTQVLSDEPGETTDEGGETTETETVKFTVPPQETVKMLGRLEVISGHDEPEIPLMAPVSQRGPSGAGHRYTIGRSPASAEDKYTHIQLKPRTVSREQAELSHVSNSFRLTNLVSEQKNPTLVNGAALEKGEQVQLSDGDVITMGEVKLRLHAGI